MVNAEEKVREMLNKIATEHNYENYKIVISRLTTGGANYTSKLFTAVIRAPKKDDIHLFAKVAAMGNAFRNDLPIDLYKNEVFAYTKLAKIYASLEEQNGVPEEHRLKFTKLYGYDLTTFQETIVLENLMEQGYGPHNRFQSIDWDYGKEVVASLAKLHALSLAFKQQQENEYEDSLEALQNQWKENSSVTAMFKKAANSAFEKVNPEYKQRLQKFLGDLKNPFVDMCKSTRCTVITHGDFNGNNLLHKKREVSV